MGSCPSGRFSSMAGWELRAAPESAAPVVRTADLLPVSAAPGEDTAGATGASSASSEGWIGDADPSAAAAAGRGPAGRRGVDDEDVVVGRPVRDLPNPVGEVRLDVPG